MSENKGRTQSDAIPFCDRNLFDFPCCDPKEPQMRSTEARLQTFNCSAWPANEILTTPEQIADAGMYYIGERDRVRCWYCNGGFQNWNEQDPWEDHAKWFPLCEFVLQQKGPEYVRAIVSNFPGLGHPIIYNPSTATSIDSLRQLIFSPPSSPRPPVLIDPYKMRQSREDKVNSDMENSRIVEEARLRGFSDEKIRRALTK